LYFKSLIAWAHITVRYHMLLSIVFIFGIWFRLSIFLLIELPTILFAVLHEMKQTGKYQGDYLVQKLKNPNVREYPF